MVRRNVASKAGAMLFLSCSVRALLTPVARKRPPFSACNSGLFFGGKPSGNDRRITGRQQHIQRRGLRAQSLLIRSMYLPPNGPNRGNNNGLGPVLQSVLTFLFLVGFFLSPLGGFFFAMLQFSFALTILIPMALVASFQVWQYFNTISGPCPTCGAPLRVFKDQASICLNCGSIVETDASQSKINLVKSVKEDEEWQRATGGGMGWVDGYFGARPTPSSQIRRERTIIDVQVQDEDD